MSDKSTIARPYAVAVFEIAKETNEIDEWGGFLEALQVIISNSDFAKLVENPVFTADLALEVVLECLTSTTSKDQENFIKLLLSSGRVNVYPEIKGIFDTLRKEDSGILTAEVFTPYALSEKEKKIIESVLMNQLFCCYFWSL